MQPAPIHSFGVMVLGLQPQGVIDFHRHILSVLDSLG